MASTTRSSSTTVFSGKGSPSVRSPGAYASRFVRRRTTTAFFKHWRSYGVLLVGLVAGLVAFAHITEDYLTGDPIVRWDVRFARWLHVHASDPLVRVFDVVTLGGNSIVLLVVVLALGIVLLRRARRNEAALLVLAFGGAATVNALLKLIFHRPRAELAFVHLDTYSFPSGHAAVSTATFTVLAFLLARRYATWRARLLIAAATVVAIALVGFSRLYLGAHYLSDVLAGISFGFAWAMLSLLAYTWWSGRAPSQS